MSVIEAFLQTRLELPKATARKNGKHKKQILQQIPQCSSSKGITIGLAWHFITKYYTPAKKSLSQNTETTIAVWLITESRLPEFGCEDMIGHRSDDQLCLLSSKFKYIIFPVPTCIVTIYWNITNPPSEQLPVGLTVSLIALDFSTALVSLRSWIRTRTVQALFFF